MRLNHDATSSAHFSVLGQTFFLGVTRLIRGLNETEGDDAIRCVLLVAGGLGGRLEELPGRLSPAKAQLPDIKLRPKQAVAIGARLAYADPHAQLIFRTMMEEWHRKGHAIGPG